MVSPVDPHEVRLTGENSFIRLMEVEGGAVTTRASHWRVLYSPHGPGHVLFLESELTNNQASIWADNTALARWLQEEIEIGLYPAFADQSTPVVEASFSRHGDGLSSSTEKVIASDTEITLTWNDLADAFVFRPEAGTVRPELPHGVYSTMVPARKAQLLVNGKAAKGRAFRQDRGDRESSTCALAWSETWTRPR
jgi:hypothetical protein